ncbi:cystatin-like [Carcharodon carcharias]|uniref:cystatin-like n=1 Tax=Carcharodon carcharias TaxID=13397 RepID=UPI001B7F13A9|nr:cystatin-like [Carcharodon carcharias]
MTKAGEGGVGDVRGPAPRPLFIKQEANGFWTLSFRQVGSVMMLGVARGVVAVVFLASLVICAQLFGALESVSTEQPEVLDAAHFAMSEYNKASNDMYLYKIMRIVSAQQQIVSGLKYVIQAEVGRTQCRRGAVDDLESCEFHETPQKTLCSFEVLVVPWREEISMMMMTCRPSNN